MNKPVGISKAMPFVIIMQVARRAEPSAGPSGKSQKQAFAWSLLNLASAQLAFFKKAILIISQTMASLGNASHYHRKK
jgi:hypothetical protein